MEENATEVKDKDLVLIEASNEVSKPDEGEDVVQDNSEQEQLRSDVEFLSMMTGVDLGGDLKWVYIHQTQTELCIIRMQT